MKGIFIFLLTIAQITLFAQSKGPITLEIKGEVSEILPGTSFAYGILHLKENQDTSYFQFPPQYGQLVWDNVRPGSQVELKVRVRPMTAEARRKLLSANLSFLNEITAIRVQGEWVPLTKSNLLQDLSDGFLEKRVRDIFSVNGFKVALLFDQGLVTYIPVPYNSKNPFEQVQRGDYVSFYGLNLVKRTGFIYPVSPVNTVVTFFELKKISGTVKSFLYKQNYVCMGLVLNTGEGELRFGFGSNLAKTISDFVKKHETITVYYSPFKIDGLLNPAELRALASAGDTLRIQGRYYFGGEDVRHDHKESSAEGKISAINLSDRGQILSIILGNDYYIEIDRDIEKQLGSYLKRGKVVKVEGMERIKIEGEIYSRDYKIITPKKIVLDEKTFLINPQP